MAAKVSVNPLPPLAVRSDYMEFRPALLNYILEKKAMNLAFPPLHAALIAMTPNQVARQRRDVPDVQPPAGNAGHVAVTLYSAELEYQRKNGDIMDDIEAWILRSMTPAMQAQASAADDPFAGLSLREKIASMDVQFMTFNTSELTTYQDELRHLAPGKTLAENLVRFRQVHLILLHANHPVTDEDKHLYLTRALEQHPRYRSFLTSYNYKDEAKTLARLEREVLLWDSQSPDLLDAPTTGQAYATSTSATASPTEQRLDRLEQAIAALKPSRTVDNPKVISARGRPLYWQADKTTLRKKFCARHGFTSTHDTSACRAAPFPVDTSTPAKLKAYLLTL
jgi:hypothetical protein